MKKILLILCLALAVALSACQKLDGKYNDAVYNYEVLWQTLDERYCFFTYKQINWDSLHDVYRQKLKLARNTEAVFKTYCDLMAHLRDGHVNLMSAGNVGRYWNWYSEHPHNFSQEVVEQYYLGEDYRIASAMNYVVLRSKTQNPVGYVRYESFNSGFGAGNMAAMFRYFDKCCGLILDVRDNGGGYLNYAEELAGYFANQRTLYGYLCHKTGRGHDDFSTPVPCYLSPNENVRWSKPVVVLTNRRCYSATNSFVNMAKNLPNVVVMGDSTGGGGGLPFESELPCGWIFRFSAVPMLNANKEHIENGIAPHIRCAADTSAFRRGIDTMIETAADYLQSKE